MNAHGRLPGSSGSGASGRDPARLVLLDEWCVALYVPAGSAPSVRRLAVRRTNAALRAVRRSGRARWRSRGVRVLVTPDPRCRR